MWRKIQLILAYDGSAFHGWQTQPGMRTVQSTINEVLRRILRHPVGIIGSGRTDAGVHAVGQAGHIETSVTIPVTKLHPAIGGRLPRDISLVRIRDVHPDFYATRSATSKCYRYRIYHSPSRPVRESLEGRCFHFWRPLDLDRLREAARHFVGTHDFSAMASSGSPRESYVRTILSVSIHQHFREVVIDVVGTGFLYNQVRNMVGTMLEVGRGHWPPDRIPEILASRDRRYGGPTAPAKGLCLQWVRYPPHLLRPPGETKPNSSERAALPRSVPTSCESATSSPA